MEWVALFLLCIIKGDNAHTASTGTNEKRATTGSLVWVLCVDAMCYASVSVEFKYLHTLCRMWGLRVADQRFQIRGVVEIDCFIGIWDMKLQHRGTKRIWNIDERQENKKSFFFFNNKPWDMHFFDYSTLCLYMLNSWADHMCSSHFTQSWLLLKSWKTPWRT